MADRSVITSKRPRMQQVRMYSTNFCPFCVQAKRLLDSLSIKFEELKLDNDHELRMKLSKENGGWRTVPMIFIGDEFVGGFQELAALHSKGELESKVNS